MKKLNAGIILVVLSLLFSYTIYADSFTTNNGLIISKDFTYEDNEVKVLVENTSDTGFETILVQVDKLDTNDINIGEDSLYFNGALLKPSEKGYLVLGIYDDTVALRVHEVTTKVEGSQDYIDYIPDEEITYVLDNSSTEADDAVFSSEPEISKSSNTASKTIDISSNQNSKNYDENIKVLQEKVDSLEKEIAEIKEYLGM